MAEVASPANQITVEFLNHLLDCYTSSVTGQLTHSHLKSVKTLRGNAPLGFFAGYYAKAKKLASPRPVYFALDLQFELAGNEFADIVHYPKSCTFTANIDVTIIRISNKAMTSSLQLSVKLVKNYI
jgi:hypothetical protein